MRLQLLSDCFCDFALDSEHIGKVACVGLRPEMRVVPSIDQLRINSNLVCDALDAPFQYMRDSERPADVLQIPGRRILVLRYTRPADHFQVGDLRQIRQDFILNAVGKNAFCLSSLRF